MTFKRLAYRLRNGGRNIAIFGTARLVRNEAGRVQLIGGMLDERRTTREWCSLLLHEAVIDVHPQDAQLAAA